MAQAVDSFSRSEQRWEFANTAAAVVLLSVALAAIALFCFRPRTHDLTLICLALFCILFAVRLLSYLASFRSLFDESPKFWSYVAWAISSVLIFPVENVAGFSGYNSARAQEDDITLLVLDFR